MRPPEATSPSPGSTPAQAPPTPVVRSLANSACLEGFELQGVIAESSAAIVYLATDQALMIPIAIKEYMPRQLARHDAASRVVPLSPAQAATFERGLRVFVDEARTLARCDHPSLLRVVRLLEANGTAYSMMPHYVGHPLTEVRRGTGAAPDEASLRALLGRLLGALEVFHRIGGVHGGVTPGNILMLRDDRPLLLGPGAVSREIGSDRIEALMAYLKPPTEHSGATDDWPTGPWTDFYSLAKVARFCITGRLSGEATSAPGSADKEPLSELIQRLAHGSAQPHYTASFLDALDAAASPLPHQRPQSVAQFREWLAHGPSGLPTPAGVALRESRPDTGLLTEPITAAVPDNKELAAPAAASPYATLRASPEAELPSLDRLQPRRPLVRDPITDPKFVGEPVRLGAELGSVTNRVAGEQDTKRGSQAPDAQEASATSGFNPGPRRRRRVGLWSSLALGMVLVLVLVGAWVFNQQPVRIDGWAQGLAAIAPGPASRAANSVATAGVVLPDVAVQSSVPLQGGRASPPTAEPNPVVSATPSGANVAEVAGVAPAVTSAVAAPVVATVRPAAPAASQAAASVRASLATTRPARPMQRAARAAAPQQAVAQNQSSPREACAGRTQFALYHCMQTQCGQHRWAGHAQCERLRATDQVD